MLVFESNQITSVNYQNSNENKRKENIEKLYNLVKGNYPRVCLLV